MHFAHGIVGAGKSPGGGVALVEIGAAPAFVAGFAVRGSGVEAPDFFAGEGVVRGDVAVFAFARAGAAADTLPSTTMGRRRCGRGHRSWFPSAARRCGRRGRRRAVGRRVEHDVLIDGEGFGARLAGDIGGDFALVLPEKIAGGAIERLHDGAGRDDIHDAVMDERDGFGLAGADAASPDHAELVDVLFGDLFERAVALGVVGAAEHQPVVRTGIFQHLLSDRDIALDLREGGQSCKTADGRESFLHAGKQLYRPHAPGTGYASTRFRNRIKALFHRRRSSCSRLPTRTPS